MRRITPALSDSRKRSIDFTSWEGGTWLSLGWDQHCTGHNGDPRVILCIAWPGSTHVPGFFHSTKAVGDAVVTFPNETIKQGLLSVFSSPTQPALIITSSLGELSGAIQLSGCWLYQGG